MVISYIDFLISLRFWWVRKRFFFQNLSQNKFIPFRTNEALSFTLQPVSHSYVSLIACRIHIADINRLNKLILLETDKRWSPQHSFVPRIAGPSFRNSKLCYDQCCLLALLKISTLAVIPLCPISTHLVYNPSVLRTTISFSSVRPYFSRILSSNFLMRHGNAWTFFTCHIHDDSGRACIVATEAHYTRKKAGNSDLKT